MTKRKALKIILLVLVTRLGFLLLREFRGFSWLSDVDGYTTYAQALFSGSLLTGWVREHIFPGFSLIIGLIHLILPGWKIAGVASVLVGDLIAFLAIGSLFSLPVALLSLFFPPAFVWSTSQIYSEGVMLGLVFGSLWLWKRQKFMLSFLFSGISILVRPIGVTLLASYLVIAVLKNDFRRAIEILVSVLSTVLALLAYNLAFFGDPLFNLRVYSPGSSGLLPFFSVWENLLRLVRDGGYRTLLSGSFYVFLTTAGLVVLWLNRKRSEFHKLVFIFALFTWVFLFSVGPNAFFEDYGRYALFLYPLSFWGFWEAYGVSIPSWVYPILFLVTILAKNT